MTGKNFSYSHRKRTWTLRNSRGERIFTSVLNFTTCCNTAAAIPRKKFSPSLQNAKTSDARMDLHSASATCSKWTWSSFESNKCCASDWYDVPCALQKLFSRDKFGFAPIFCWLLLGKFRAERPSITRIAILSQHCACVSSNMRHGHLLACASNKQVVRLSQRTCCFRVSSCSCEHITTSMRRVPVWTACTVFCKLLVTLVLFIFFF